jgi:hypothetical protein
VRRQLPLQRDASVRDAHVQSGPARDHDARRLDDSGSVNNDHDTATDRGSRDHDSHLHQLRL